MITHCPSCHTHFRVHAEQLAARAGQVRCGKCSRVFNALEHLIEDLAPARSPRSPEEFEAPYADTAAADQVPEAALTQAADVGADDGEPAIANAADVVAEPLETGTEPPAPATLEPALPEPAKVEAETAPDAGAFDFGPVAAAEPPRPLRRWPWLLGALLMLLTLLAQAAYHYRGAITLLFPETKPYATALCASLGCELPLPRRIDMMSIEASDLQADTTNPNVMVLSATIKNRAIFNQQHPLLELTLTDAQDQPVVRRVLAPQDFLGKAVNTQAGFAGNSEIAIKVFIEGSQVKATGYRLYLFYP
jgi:predicted Zn finger-like uncharacterized protein